MDASEEVGSGEPASNSNDVNDPFKGDTLKQALEDEENLDDSKVEEIIEDDINEDNIRESQKSWSESEIKSAHEEVLKLKGDGNQLFLSEKYLDAIQAYSDALRMCPLQFSKDRAIIYQNRGACKSRLNQTDQAIKDLTKAVELDPNYFKARLKRAQVLEQAEKLEEALQDYEHLIKMDPRNKECFEACRRLPERINERNEKLKTEMMSKLKDLGNLVLRPFGLSTDNFQLTQDPKTGGYSVNMQNSK
ncbi:unnamed protein product [Notodromas monacha]|uniref:Tetratricopeptide repeat protein 1 n=1 Tax=Notodromas monacha TaxID=399045 RepID=A0A7R9G9Q9_9CRUS|nr:unnamed protein product [Notodromas monacha]CAG0914527.1 unnamed protein product [Notodromas monacha]